MFVCCRLGTTFVCRLFGAVFVYVREIQKSNVYPINDKKLNQWSSIYCRIEIISILVII